MEDREADRKSLPKRHRYYTALTDAKALPTSVDYTELPDYLSITISSYVPFLLGEMYYEARTCIVDHPDYSYNDGVTHLFLYADGKVNIKDADHGKKLHELLKYIVSGEKPSTPDKEINEIDNIVNSVKSRPEVTKAYMRQWEKEIELQRETKIETQKEDAINLIQFSNENNISEDSVRQNLREKYEYNDSEIDELFKEALASLK